MSHLVERMAYVGSTPWHGLGNQLTEGEPLEVWLQQAGMAWTIRESPVLFEANDAHRPFAETKVLFRSDSLAPLSVVSQRYKVVQPSEVLEFYRDLVEVSGFALETAGVLKGGKKLWALAKTGQEAVLKGGDQVRGYLLLATACDGTLATTAQWTSVRVVCNNTLELSLGTETGAIKVPHSTQFNPAEVKKQLGLGISAWDSFIANAKALADRKVTKFEAMRYLVQVFGDPDVQLSDQPNQAVMQQIHALFDGQGKGSKLDSSQGTAWGLLNAVTEYVDHDRKARSADNRLNSAWFGPGKAIKQKAFEEAVKLAA